MYTSLLWVTLTGPVAIPAPAEESLPWRSDYRAALLQGQRELATVGSEAKLFHGDILQPVASFLLRRMCELCGERPIERARLNQLVVCP